MNIDPNQEELSEDKEDALISEEDALNQNQIISDQSAAEHDADLLDQADKSSRSSFELDLD
ncbi:hypothetical protein HDC90_004142 [Pedobacter sp. AK013]|uniref:hypothetical protein n=1 Tax=Pedobacter sp. AK013 TaxID=2723071 RepID=UPI00161DA368|nr:hypothetical protein [Pedobacter sp. AK013]MBB6239489.1 hypothetical protein [Pedobacter sp. AK013]